MNNVLACLILATAGAVLLFSFPPVSGFHPSYGWWNGTNNSIWNPYRDSNKTIFNRYYNLSSAHPVNRYPRSSYWGNSSNNASHNFIWGRKSAYDRLLYFTRVKRSSSFMRKVTLDMDFPAKYQRPNGTISYMEVLDQKPAGEGGFATIRRGGIGYKNVTFHFKSQRNKGFDFTVSIYGY